MEEQQTRYRMGSMLALRDLSFIVFLLLSVAAGVVPLVLAILSTRRARQAPAEIEASTVNLFNYFHNFFR